MNRPYSRKLRMGTGLSKNGRELNVRLVDDLPGGGRAGELITMTLNPSDVTISEELSTFLMGFKAPTMRADEVCPIMEVTKDEGQYRIYGLNNAFKLVAGVISSIQADIPEVDVETSLDSYKVTERALGSFVPSVTQYNADNGSSAFDPGLAAAQRVGTALALEREVRVWTLLTTSGSWNSNNRATIAGGSQWDDPENCDPILDLMDRIEASAQPVEHIWMNQTVSHCFLRAKAVKEYMKFIGGDANAINTQVATAVGAQGQVDFTIAGLPPIHVVASKVLNETTLALDYILNDTVVLTANPALSTKGDAICTCKTFRRAGPGGSFVSREIDLPRRGLHGGKFHVMGHAEQIKMVSGLVGGAIFDVLS